MPEETDDSNCYLSLAKMRTCFRNKAKRFKVSSTLFFHISCNKTIVSFETILKSY